MIDILLKDCSREINHYLKRLFSINRSITGNGNRETLAILNELVSINVSEYSSGTPVFDWKIPSEWSINDAWIKNEKGPKIVSFKENNLHVVGYSEPVEKSINFEELDKHLYVHDKLDNAVPYRTTYYKKDWGFCLSKYQYEIIKNSVGPFKVFIDSKLDLDGSLTIGEVLTLGKLERRNTYFDIPLPSIYGQR